MFCVINYFMDVFSKILKKSWQHRTFFEKVVRGLALMQAGTACLPFHASSYQDFLRTYVISKRIVWSNLDLM
jgi:hypothetical protein